MWACLCVCVWGAGANKAQDVCTTPCGMRVRAVVGAAAAADGCRRCRGNVINQRPSVLAVGCEGCASAQ